jgi:diaminopimelate decarboxylase
MDPFPPLLSAREAQTLCERFGSPAYVYSEAELKRLAREALAFPAPFGLKVRFAVKAAPNWAILRLFHSMGLGFDASSGFEVERILRAGVPAKDISLSCQELPANFADLIEAGIHFNACSLRQLDAYGRRFPGRAVGLRVNPGMGSGHSKRTTVAGPSSSFGIWHEHLPDVLDVCRTHGLRITTLHTHIGSGADPQVWARVIEINLGIVRQLPDVTTLNMGGGFKVARVPGEQMTDMQLVGAPARQALENFARETGRKLPLELEPGTFLAATAGAVVCTVQDLAHTGADGYHFLKLDSGMTEILRPSLYGAQHTIRIYPRRETGRTRDYVVVGHCCESGDVLTPAPGNSEELRPRTLPESQIGDICVIEGAGAYCSAMPAKNYNSFPTAPEVMLREDGTLQLIRRRQSLDDMLADEAAVMG